jgi:hypothetical protein
MGRAFAEVGVDVAAQLAGQIRDGSEDAACDHIRLDSCKPEFFLAELDE